MKSPFKLLPIALLTLVILTACATVPQTESATTTPSEIKIYTAIPSQTPVAEAATSTPAPQGPAPSLASLHMLDAQAGWAWTTEGHLLRTADGGKTWVDRTPPGYQYTDWGFFLDAQAAWLPVYLPDSSRFALLHTGDGGATWAEYPQGPATGLHFADALNGWAVSGDVGAGNVYFSLSQTSDGGKTWAPIPARPPEPEAGLSAGVIHLCNICNDAFYYDPGRMVIVYGDLGSMEAGGSVRVQVSFDLGATWKALNLPLPQGEGTALVAPNQPVFFDEHNGLLPIHLLKMDATGTFSEQKLAFYTTSDGGASWSQLPTILDAIPAFETMQTDFSQDAFIICGNALCASHDQGRTWQKLSSDLDFTATDTHSVSGIDFVNGNSGWVLVSDNAVNSLYATSDGGSHWALLSPMLAGSTPPTVTVDTSIPTPTPVPTATLEPTPTPDVSYDAQAKADRVKFAPYQTWVELSGATSLTGDVRYVLSALQYQTMSVSIRQGAAFTVEVAGADHKTLTDPNNPQPYWRGVLPSTQDYFVTIKSQVEAPFDLRIAINPQGLSNQFFDYVDPQYKVALGYSDMFAPVSWQLPFTTKGTPLLTLYFIEPTYYYPTTNLNEAALLLAASSDPAIVSSCTQPAQPGEVITGTVTVNGYTFTQSDFTGAAAGNRYEQISNRTVWQGQCFEVIFLIHTGEIGNYPPGTVVEYDRQRLLHHFQTVLDTFIAK